MALAFGASWDLDGIPILWSDARRELSQPDRLLSLLTKCVPFVGVAQQVLKLRLISSGALTADALLLLMKYRDGKKLSPPLYCHL